MANPAVVFGGVGAFMWALLGFVGGMGYYAPAAGAAALKQDKALAQAVAAATWSAACTTAAISAGVGLVFGLLVMSLYRAQGEYARNMPAPGPPGGGPRLSMAEVEVTPRAVMLSVLLGLLVAWLVPPYLAKGLIVAKALPFRLFFGAVLAFFGGASVLPYSLKQRPRFDDDPRTSSSSRRRDYADAPERSRSSDWGTTTIGPKRDVPPKVKIHNPSPALCRLTAFTFVVGAGYGLYHTGQALLGLGPLNYAAPVWTAPHVVLVVVTLVLALIAGLLGFGLGSSVKTNDAQDEFWTCMWGFLVTGGLLWFTLVGGGMSLALGKEAAKAAVISAGPERATLHAIFVAASLSLLLGLGFVTAKRLYIQPGLYVIAALLGALVAARWHLGMYGVHGSWWIGVGTLYVLLVIPGARGQMARDQRERKIIQEQFETEGRAR